MSKKNILYLTELAILTAIIFLMSFTPLGFLKMGVIEITFILIPVIIGAIIMGPTAGAILGGMFGLTSFIQCFGLSPFGAMLLHINPVYTAILCIIPRVLVGLLVGLIFRGMSGLLQGKKKVLAFLVPSISGALINTLLFVGGLLLIFGGSTEIQKMLTDMGGGNVVLFFAAFVGINGLVEAIACAFLGTILGTALYKVHSKMRLQ